MEDKERRPNRWTVGGCGPSSPGWPAHLPLRVAVAAVTCRS